MPNTGMVRHQGFKHEIYEKKLKETRFKTLELPKVGTHVEKCQPIFNDYLKTRKTKNKRTFVEIEENHRTRFQQTAPAPFPKISTNFLMKHAVPDGSNILQRNKLAPFSTLGKATCGFNFSRETDNKKKNFGIMPSNLVKWRSDKVEKIAVA